MDGVLIIGGASKLFKYSIDRFNFDDIVTWSDNRWSFGNVYEKLGFINVSEKIIEYSYVDPNSKYRESKQSWKKGTIHKDCKQPRCPDNWTEDRWTDYNGRTKIWDCGIKQWVWKRI